VVAQAFAILMAVLGFRYNLFLVFIAVFIWIGAVAEARMANVKFALSGLSVGKAMLTDFQVLQHDESLAQAVKLTLSGTQKDFPVLAGDKVIGVLRQSDLLRGLHDHGKLCRVDQEMQGDVPHADISEPLEAVMERMQVGESGLLIVTDGSRIAGIIDIDNIMELLRIQKALHEHDEHRW